MKRFSAVFALTALAAATVGLAQQTPPPAEPPASSPSATAPPADSGARTEGQSSRADKQAMMKDCLSQVKAANPGVPDKDIKAFCDKEVNQPSPPHD